MRRCEWSNATGSSQVPPSAPNCPTRVSAWRVSSPPFELAITFGIRVSIDKVSVSITTKHCDLALCIAGQNVTRLYWYPLKHSAFGTPPSCDPALWYAVCKKAIDGMLCTAPPPTMYTTGNMPQGEDKTRQDQIRQQAGNHPLLRRLCQVLCPSRAVGRAGGRASSLLGAWYSTAWGSCSAVYRQVLHVARYKYMYRNKNAHVFGDRQICCMSPH